MRWMSDASTLDAIDRRILRALQTDGRILKREVRDCVQHLSPHLAPKLQREMVDDLWGILSR